MLLHIQLTFVYFLDAFTQATSHKYTAVSDFRGCILQRLHYKFKCIKVTQLRRYK